MSVAPPKLRPLSRRHPTVRAVARRWRALTGGPETRDPDRRTLVACSAGPDSSALALALAAASPDSVVIAHILHDLRPSAEAAADRDLTRDLASELRVPFAQAEVRVADLRGNAEGHARRARYAALAQLAAAHGCPYVATAHHAADQLETILLRLIRGSGPRALAGIRATRSLGDVTLVRPLLHLTPGELRAVCDDAAWTPAHDRTNDDTSRARASMRHGVVATLLARHPHAAERAAESAELIADAGDLVEHEAAALFERAKGGAGTEAPSPYGIVLDRRVLAEAPSIVLGEVLRLAHHRLLSGERRARLRASELRRVAAQIGARECAHRETALAGVRVRLTPELVEITPDV